MSSWAGNPECWMCGHEYEPFTGDGDGACFYCYHGIDRDTDTFRASAEAIPTNTVATPHGPVGGVVASAEPPRGVLPASGTRRP